MTFQNTRWRIAPPPPPDHLRSFAGHLDPLILQVLYHRGLTDPAAVEAFLSWQAPHATDPFNLKGMDIAVDRIGRAIRDGESIAVYGDYDADGVTGSVLLVQALRAMGASRVQPYIPNRMGEGYGLNNEALERLALQGNTLVITVDCGTRAVGQVHHANSLGMDVIITDHHAVSHELPPAVAILNPKQESDGYPDQILAGVGIAFKLVQGLVRAGIDSGPLVHTDLLDLVALGTVADLAPLLGENRMLVHQGLELINSRPRPGVAALMQKAGVRQGQVTSETIGFALGPRINAAGRMSSAHVAARLLISDDPGKTQLLAAKLDGLNRDRQDQTRQLTQFAEELALEEGEELPLLFAADPGFPSGVVGLIASRLVESYYKPAIVVQIRSDVAVGSCRSIPEFHITRALDQCSDLLVKHGGHTVAAGFTVTLDNLQPLKQRLTAMAAEQLAGEKPVPALDIAARLALNDITWGVHDALAHLEPCGYRNPVPLLYSPDVQVVSWRTVGSTGAHLKLVVAEEGQFLDAIAFGMGEFSSQMRDRMDIVYHLEENEWNGRVNLQLNIQDMRPAGEGSE
jgi:single-stranded-DNA-specific exonuclease